MEELYTADQPVKLTPAECAQVLGQVQAVVVLDDVSLDPEQVAYVLGVLPGCALVLSSPRPILGRHGNSQTLIGLADDAALQLVTTDLGRPLSSQELPAVKRLVVAVEGQPLHLRQAAALVREDGHSFQTLAKKAEHDPEVLDRLSLDALAEHERRALAVLALAAGALLPKELVAAMGDIAQIGECLNLLHRRGLADQHDDRFGLPACKVESYRQLLLKYLHLAAALQELSGWLSARDPTSGESTSAAGAALAIVGFAAERGDWPTVVRLVRVVEPILTLAGRWEASRHLLDHGLRPPRRPVTARPRHCSRTSRASLRCAKTSSTPPNGSLSAHSGCARSLPTTPERQSPATTSNSYNLWPRLSHHHHRLADYGDSSWPLAACSPS